MGADILDPHGPLQHRALGLAELPAAEMIAARDWLAPRRPETGKETAAGVASGIGGFQSAWLRDCSCSLLARPRALSLLVCFFFFLKGKESGRKEGGMHRILTGRQLQHF